MADTAPLVAACCSRRAGKTWGLAYKLYDAAQTHAWSTSLYLTNTRPQAKRIIWPVLQRINTELKLGAKFNAVELTAKLPNGSQIILGGTNDEYEIERYRGPAYALAVIDEAQSIRAFIETLIEEILEPATLDLRGQILLTGTPNAACLGFFRDVCKGVHKGWSLHSWTLLDNPQIPHARAWLEDLKKRRGIRDDDPKFLREYGAQWVRDSGSQAYKIGDRNLIPRFPEEWADDWEYVLGIDLGFVGTTAFVVLAFSVAIGKVVVVESYQVTPAHYGTDELLFTPSMLAQEVNKLRSRYDFVDMVVDPGGLGAKYIEDIRRRFKIPLKAAEKKAKLGAVEILNGDLLADPPRLLLVEPANRDLIHDARMLELRWDLVDEESKKRGTVSRSDLVIDDRTPDHLTDALTYGHRRCRAYLHEPSENAGPPRRGSAAREEWEERARELRELDASLSGDERPWWAAAPDDTFSL